MQHETNQRLAGRTALVTGAGSPVGRAVCERFASEGAWIVAVDGDFDAARATADAARAAGVPAIGLKTEALDPTITENIVATAIERLWQVDILVNTTTPIADPTLDGVTDWAATLAINLEASYRFARATLPQMRERHTGVIVNVGWCWGDSRDPAEAQARDTSEAAVAALTRRLADDYGADGVRIHGLCPAPAGRETATPLEQAVNGTTHRVGADATPQRVADWITVLAAQQPRPPARGVGAILRRE